MALHDERLKSTVGGKYRIVRFLAEGGMGSVYEAQHLVVKRRFAVKFLRADLARRRDVLLRFKREAEATGALEAENIAAAVDFGIADNGAPYIVMEYLDGVDLGTLLARGGPLPLERATDLVTQACRGMQAAHATGVVHRDLKPQNLFVCRRGDGSDLVKIVDFGVAKLLAGDLTSQVTRTGSMVGTPSYMSPEQARGETDVDARADIHALGVILFELLSGCTPHRGDSFNAIIHNIATQPPMPLRCEGREFSPELERVVARALSSNPADRQPSAGHLADELAPFARREVWPPSIESPPPVETGDADTEPAAQANSARHTRRFPVSPLETSEDVAVPRRSAARLVGFSGLLLAMLLGTLWFSTRSSASKTHEEGTSPRAEEVSGNVRTPVAPSVALPVAPPVLSPSVPSGHAVAVAADSIPLRAPSRHGDNEANRQTVGRPAKSPTPATTTSGPSPSVAAAFDTRNPYD